MLVVVFQREILSTVLVYYDYVDLELKNTVVEKVLLILVGVVHIKDEILGAYALQVENITMMANEIKLYLAIAGVVFISVNIVFVSVYVGCY